MCVCEWTHYTGLFSFIHWSGSLSNKRRSSNQQLCIDKSAPKEREVKQKNNVTELFLFLTERPKIFYSAGFAVQDLNYCFFQETVPMYQTFVKQSPKAPDAYYIAFLYSTDKQLRVFEFLS